MNEYTRREEVRWTLITAVLLVLCIAGAILRLTTAKGSTMPDPQAQAAAAEAKDRVDRFDGCAAAANKLVEETGVFRDVAKAAGIGADPAPKEDADKNKKKKSSKKKGPDASLAWSAGQAAHKQATTLGTCRVLAGEAIEEAPATPGWEAVNKAASVSPPGDEEAKAKAAADLLAALDEQAFAAVVTQVVAAEKELADRAEKAQAAAKTATIRAPLPQGLLGRKVAIAVGLALSLIALLVSFFSVRAASIRRAMTLIPLRNTARTDDRGLQAAALLQLAGQPNGGEPGIVIGAALGGLVAAALQPQDADWFVAGVMSGLVVGVLVQLVIRLTLAHSKWRERAMELAEIEKPAIPIVLVLSGINPGMEGQFIDFFKTLQPKEAAAAVEKLAAQAEERILAAADAGVPPGPGAPPGR